MKKVHGVPYLFKRGEVFYFRKKINPQNIDTSLSGEVKFSLKTRDKRIAQKRCMRLSLFFIEFQECMGVALFKRQDPVMDAKKTYFDKCLARCKAIAPEILDGDPTILAHELEHWENQYCKLLRAKVTGESCPSSELQVLQEVKLQGGSVGPSEQEDYFLDPDIEIARIMVAMYQRNFKEALPVPPFGGGEIQGNRHNLSEVEKNPLSEVSQKYVFVKSRGAWCKKTEVDHRRVLRFLVDHVGADLPIQDVNLEIMRVFRDNLLSLPSNAAKIPQLKELSFSELMAVDKKWPRVSTKTAKKYFDMANGFLGWCVEEGYIPSNPAQRLRIQHKFNPQNARFPFSPAQLESLFTSPLYTGCKSKLKRWEPGNFLCQDDKFWVPLVGLYTGMRLGEIIELDIQDIQEEEGIMLFSVGGTEGGKRLKTENAKRVIPIHEDLISLGFLDFLGERRAHKNGHRVFKNLPISETGYSSHNYSKWFSRYLAKTRVKTPKTSFHSFRHNFKDALRLSGAPEGVQNRLMGHSESGVQATYGSGWQVSTLAKEINSVNFTRFVSHLMQEVTKEK